MPAWGRKGEARPGGVERLAGTSRHPVSRRVTSGGFGLKPPGGGCVCPSVRTWAAALFDGGRVAWIIFNNVQVILSGALEDDSGKYFSFPLYKGKPSG